MKSKDSVNKEKEEQTKTEELVDKVMQQILNIK